jgi:aerobic carbon-monoxide dehydrogenase large subunit
MSYLTSREQVAPQGIGKPVRRREDMPLLTGAAHFADDVSLPGQAYACLLRSPYAHARITSIDVAAAEGATGVLAVLTGSDADTDGLQPIPHRPVPANPHEVPLKSRGGAPFFIAPHPVLAVGKVGYFGKPVAVVLAETLPQAIDAAERVAVEYEWEGSLVLPRALQPAPYRRTSASATWFQGRQRARTRTLAKLQ